MKVPVRWLAEFIDVESFGLEKLADILTMAGLEVEEIHENGQFGPVYVTKTTPNRGDWLSIYGVAREAAAAMAAHGGTELRHSKLGVGALPKTPLEVPVTINVPDWCPRYAAMIVEIDSPGISPSWIQDRLTAAGMRPINAVVDVTNYVMLELGQPLHAFDLATVAGPEIIVRAARDGETITTLDGKERILNPNIMVIADRDKPSAVAGIMGGEGSEVTESTRRVFIESAHFNPAIVRAGAKMLGLSTDASYRYERFVDPALVPRALLAASQLIAELTGGKIVDGSADVYPKAVVPRRINLRTPRAEQILGMSLEGGKGDAGLSVMGFHFQPGDDENGRTVVVPTHRPDVTLEIDLIEEIGRMIGYDNLPETLPHSRSSHGGGRDSPDGVLIDQARNILIGQGLSEVFTHTLSAPSVFDDPEKAARRVRIRTALSAELSGLRQSLIPNLLDVLARNARHRTPDLSIFEVGKVFWTAEKQDDVEETEYREGQRAAAVVQGDYFTAKGIVENLFAGMKYPFVDVIAAQHTGMHPGRSATITFDKEWIGTVSELDPDLLASYLDIHSTAGRFSCFEVNIDAIRFLKENVYPDKSYYPLPKFPEVVRDLAMVFDSKIPYAAIQTAALEAAEPYVESVKLVSVYTGDKIGEGKKSVALRFTLRADERTLTDADADSALTAAQNALSEQLGASSR